LPTYFVNQLGFDLASSSFLSVLPWIAMFVFANVGGILADKLIKGGSSVTSVRKAMQTIGFIGPSVFLTLVTTTKSPAVAVTCMTAALATSSFSQSGVYSNHPDIAPNYAGILLGISNTGAAIPGIVGVALTGYILESTGSTAFSWKIVFGIAIGFYLVGTVVYNAYASGEIQYPVNDELET
jgi:MFS transporter, ACS family, solute carrier family 17 (sodium-dependent inorganic phosphate cotransporter), other